MTSITVEQALAGLYGATDRLQTGGSPRQAVADARAYLSGLASVADQLSPGQRQAFGRASLALMQAMMPHAPAGSRADWQASVNGVRALVEVDAAEAKASLPAEVVVVSLPRRVHEVIRDREGKIMGSVETDD